MLKIYNQCNDPNDSDFLIDNIAGYIQPFEDYQCLNDYYHFIHHHTETPVPFSAFDTQCTSRMASPRDLNLDAHSNGDSNIYSFDRITDFFVEHCFGTKHCDERNCLCFKRNHRDRSKALSDGYYGGDHGDYSLIAFQQILDSIHCGIFHRITNEEDSERIMEIMKRRHPTLYTIDTGICIKSDDQHSMEMEQKMREWDREYDAEQNERQNASSIHAMSTQISSILKESAVNAVDTDSKTLGPLPLKSQVVSKLTSPPIPRQPHCSFGNLADAADKERDFSDAPNYIISEREYLALPYTFGPHMFYHYDDALKHPTYSDLKKELLLNTTSPMTPYQWSITEAKARIIHKTYPIHRGTNDDDDEMSINQIIAVLVYCNFDSLRRALQSSFSDKELHKKYSHWGHALFSMIKSYGITDQQLADEFEAVYCALNFPFKFYSFNHFNFNGLFSATPHLSIVTAGDISADGIILKFNSSHFGVAPFVEVSTVFSDFKDERHHLFGFSNGCVLQIDEVFTTFDLRNDTPSKTHRNKAFIAALQVFEQMVIDMPYIEDHTQYQWLQRSLDRAEGTEQGQGNGAGFSVMEILEFMITDCLSADDGTHGVDENPKLKSIKTPMTKLFALDNGDDVEHKEIERNNTECPVIPSFIETQLGFFRHCLRETEYCRLCCDLKKMELLPQSIRSKLLVDANGLNGNRDIGHIAFGNWCRLFPNDRVIAIKNMDSEQYESVIDAFVRFVSDQGVSEAVACLQCIDIDTDSKEHCDEIEDLVNGKNASDLKKVNWTLVYELVRRRIGSDEKDSYSILMKKDVVIPNEDEKEHNVQVNENLMVEYVSPLALEERKTLDIEGVDELCANIMSAVEEQKKREETPMSSGFGTDNDPFAGRWGMSGFGTDNDLDTDGGATPVDGFVTPRSLNEHESNSQPAELVH